MLTDLIPTTDAVSSAKFIAQKQWFVVGGHDGFIRVYTYDPIRKVKRFKAHYMEVRCLDVHPTKPYLLSAGWSDQIKLWDWSKGWECIKTFDMKDQAYQIKFNPMANNFAAACMYGVQVRLRRGNH
jgi:coatomer subunit beta'